MADETALMTINQYTANGSQVNWEVSFAGGYISREHVLARVYDTEDFLGEFTEPAFTWVGDFTINISPAVASGKILRIYRNTPADKPLVDFSDGSVINERTLDLNAQQAINIIAELRDRIGTTMDIDTVGQLITTAQNAAVVSAAAKLAVEDAAAEIVPFIGDLASAEGAAMVGFVQTAAGAVPASAKDKFGEILSVLDFGDRASMGEGQDATAAFTAAIDYMNTLNHPATLLLPGRARFLVNGSLPAFVRNAKYIIGEGAQITHDGGTLFTWGAGTPGSVIDGGILGLNYQGLATPTAGTCMVAQEGMNRLRLNGIRGDKVSGFLKAGLVAFAGGYFIENCCLMTHNVNNDVIRHGNGANSDIKGLNLTASGVSRVLDQTTPIGALANAITFGIGTWDTAVWNGLLVNGYKNGLLVDRTVQNKNVSNFRVSDFYFDYCADGITLRNTQTGGGINNMQFANGWVVGMDGYGVHLAGTVGSHRNITFRDVHALLAGKNNWRLASQTMDNVRILNATGDFANRLNATNTGTDRDDFVALFGGWEARGGRFGRTANGFAAAGVPNWQARYGATLPTAAANYVFEDNQIEGLTDDIQSVISNTTLTAGGLFSSSIKNNRVPGGATRPAYATTGPVAAPTSAAVQTNNTPFTYDIAIYGGTVTSIQHNGTEVGTDRANMTIRPGDTWVVVYSVAPTIKRIIWP